ncbi:thioredoxin family protein [Ruminococcus sp.]|uniref:thioredoxin family protein n=1 Tax=Ruminococcus sp. TaxID=41978 RepID=UPI002E79A32F|nr:thioredoxin family protein [Ruminococcus sp.]MEE1264175.1 thioredoxin family protein [Ruminococcus sp.]
MSFFNRKKEEEKPCCCSSGSAGSKYDVVLGEVTSVKVLGAGCKSCHQMYENTKKAVADLGLGIEVEYITNMEKVMQYGAMSMPVLVVNEKVVSAGKVLKPQEAAKMLR